MVKKEKNLQRKDMVKTVKILQKKVITKTSSLQKRTDITKNILQKKVTIDTLQRDTISADAINIGIYKCVKNL